MVGDSSPSFSQDSRLRQSRERVLRAIEAHGPISIRDLAAATALHENTVRGHLERLHVEGLIRRSTKPVTGRGRPAIEWSAVRVEDREPYAGLAVMLADALARAMTAPGGTSQHVRQITHDAGVAWGERLAADAEAIAAGATAEGDDDAAARRVVRHVMQAQGFAPTEPLDTEPPATRDALIELHACPLLAAAEGHNRVVCDAHAAMVEGIVRSRGARLDVELLPFTAPGTCSLLLRTSA
ncbi:metalloregulator ArsR/SmtB family transcription factor [Microbacterium sp. NC79]|uniref:helix-turn-helix transcriptional regulator n=1 Tax=Microbacterium sp. NC79 TaxID=2851009 RepID=UPI0020B89409|nr:winged helix-turn-helix transcriptional regulator [Microbacterium sp. NC79]